MRTHDKCLIQRTQNTIVVKTVPDGELLKSEDCEFMREWLSPKTNSNLSLFLKTLAEDYFSQQQPTIRKVEPLQITRRSTLLSSDKQKIELAIDLLHKKDGWDDAMRILCELIDRPVKELKLKKATLKDVLS